ncbi:MAG: integration host factor subunit alpha [Syntrophobacterales bacterium]|nr:integration host factor subunit alpha [Syntrophobacterales bacterium]
MAITKAELARILHSNTDLPKEKCGRVVEDMFELMKEELEQGNDVLISGFGKWSVNSKNPRKGRNPQTGEALMLDARRVVTFKCSKKLKESVN